MKTIKKRKKQRKTDYGKRFKLLKGNSPRLVMRKTNKYITAQYVESMQTRDKTRISVNSKDLIKHGWPKEFEGSLKSLPAAYLTGFLIGKKITKDKKKSPVADFGMMKVLHKTRIFAFLKGVIDAGVDMKHDEKTFPNEERISGKNLKKDFSKYFSEVKGKIENE